MYHAILKNIKAKSSINLVHLSKYGPMFLNFLTSEKYTKPPECVDIIHRTS